MDIKEVGVFMKMIQVIVKKGVVFEKEILERYVVSVLVGMVENRISNNNNNNSSSNISNKVKSISGNSNTNINANHNDNNNNNNNNSNNNNNNNNKPLPSLTSPLITLLSTRSLSILI